jgi:hypothetical protein
MGRAKWVFCVAIAFSACVTPFAAEGEFHRELKVNGAVNLQIETGSGSIQVHPGGW